MTGMVDFRQLYKIILDTIQVYRHQIPGYFFDVLRPADELEHGITSPSSKPSLSMLGRLGPTAPETRALVEAIITSTSPDMWCPPPYIPPEVTNSFIKGSVWLPVADRAGPLVMDNGLVEIMMFDTGIEYPPHFHDSEELYLVLAGDFILGTWQNDIPTSTLLQPGQLIINPSSRIHTLRAISATSLILAVWHGSGFIKPTFTNKIHRNY